MLRNPVRRLEFEFHFSIHPGVFAFFFLFLMSYISVQAFVFSELLSSCIVLAVFSFSLMFSRPSVGPIWPPIQWVQRVLSPGVSSRGVKRTIRVHPVPRLRLSGALLYYTYVPSWRIQGQHYFTFVLRLFLKFAVFVPCILM